MRKTVLLLCCFLVVSFLFMSCSSTKDLSATQEEASSTVSTSGNYEINVYPTSIYILKDSRRVCALYFDGKLTTSQEELYSLLNKYDLETALTKIEIEKDGYSSFVWSEKISPTNGYEKEFNIKWVYEEYPITYDEIGVVYIPVEEEFAPAVLEDYPSFEGVEEVVEVEDPKPLNPSSYTERDAITMLPLQKYGFDFIGWIDDGEDFSKARTYVINRGTQGAKKLVAVWSPKTVELSFELNGGEFEFDVPRQYAFGAEAFTIPAPVRENYVFVGWNVNGTVVEGPYYVDTSKEEKLLLSAEWRALEYSISYDIEGVFYSEPIPVVIEPEEPAPIIAPVNPSEYTVEDEFSLLPETKYGYIFCGWILDGDESYLADPEFHVSLGSSGNKDFVAVWAPKQFPIEYELSGGYFEECPEKAFVFGSESFVLRKPVREYYEFLGWAESDETEPVLEYSVDTFVEGALALKAIWKPVDFQITYNLDGGVIEDLDNPCSYNVETNSFVLNPPTKEGYIFIGWEVEFAHGSYGPDYVLNLSNAAQQMILEVYPDHAEFTYPESFSVDEVEMLVTDFAYTYGDSVSEYSAQISEGTTKIIYPVNQYGYLLDYFADSNLTMKAVEISTGSYGDRQYKAKWELLSYSISYDEKGVLNVSEILEVEEPKNPVSYTVLDEFTLINPTREGYVFVGWIYEGNPVSSAEEYLTIVKGSIGDRCIVPVWEKVSFNITYEMNGAEFCEEWPTSMTYGEERIILSNPNRENYVFVGWTDSESTEPEKDYVIDSFRTENLSIEANWEPKTYSITYRLEDGVLPYLEENPSSYTVEDEDFVLICPSREYYSFMGWKEADTKGNPVLEFIVDTDSARDLDLVAVWEPIEFSINYVDEGCYYKYDNVNPSSYNIESENIVIANPYKDGYTFKGWIIAGDRSETLHKNFEIKTGSHGDLKLYAEFDIERYPVGKITEMQLDVVEYGKNNIPRPDWVISVPTGYNGVHFEKAYAKESDFISSYDVAVKKAHIQICNYYGVFVSVTDKNVNDTPYSSESFESEDFISGTMVVEYWEDSVGGVWVLLAGQD